jgi:hypothetical protein
MRSNGWVAEHHERAATIREVDRLAQHRGAWATSERGLRSSAATASLLVLLALLLAAQERRIVPADSAVVVQRRLALVVGNQNYRTTPLTNPRNDGAAVAATLRRLGFDDVTERYDVTRREMDDATAQFAGRLRARCTRRVGGYRRTPSRRPRGMRRLLRPLWRFTGKQ